MRKPVTWNSTPAVVGLAALFIYILACTSFSPDDSKVLYATVDTRSGLPAVAVYDRKEGKSELLFEPFTRNIENLEAEPAMLRPQWLRSGHEFLIAWMIPSNGREKSLNLAVLPFDRRGPARTFLLSRLGDEGSSRILLWPLPVVGSSVFLSGESNTIIRLDLETGESHRQTNQQDLILFPSPDNDRLFYLGGEDVSQGWSECGLLNPETFARAPLFQIKDKKAGSSLALSRDAKRLAYQAADDNPPVVHLLESGQPARTLPLVSLGENVEVNLRQFSPKNDILYGSFKKPADGTNAAFGFIEIPLDGSPIRTTTLIRSVETKDKETDASFQIDLSHDGKTLAVESLWIAFGGASLKEQDCALFLVDLSDPQRKVTKVPIPLPSKDWKP